MIFKVNTIEESNCWKKGNGIFSWIDLSTDVFPIELNVSRIFCDKNSWCVIFGSHWSNHKNFFVDF